MVTQLADLETIFLQKIGAACPVLPRITPSRCAWPCPKPPSWPWMRGIAPVRKCRRSWPMPPPSAPARHRREGAKGFIGNANDWTAHYFGAPAGYGTMPHALIGYAGSTLRAAEMFVEAFPGDESHRAGGLFWQAKSPMGFGCLRALPRARRASRPDGGTAGHTWRQVFGRPGPAGKLRRRLNATRQARSAATAAQTELRYLIGTGVSAASPYGKCARPSTKTASTEGPHRRQFRLRRGKMQRHGRRAHAHRCRRNGELYPRTMVGDLRHRRYRRL